MSIECYESTRSRGYIEPFRKALRIARDRIISWRRDGLTIVSHIDADGISAASIVSKALERLDVDHEVLFLKQLREDLIDEIGEKERLVFLDFGSGQMNFLRERLKEFLVLDHHIPRVEKVLDGYVQVNPHLFGFDGGREISGAGLAYLLAREISDRNVDLSKLAVVGAVGDQQAGFGRLEGLNNEIAKEGVERGYIKVDHDLALFGRTTRPVFIALKYFSDPRIPGVTNDEGGAIALLNSLGIPLKDERGNWRRLVDLTMEEKRRLVDALIKRAMDAVPKDLRKYVPGTIVSEIYYFPDEPEESPLRDANEFATALNAAGRGELPEIAMRVCKGDRERYYDELLRLLREHRRRISEGLNIVKEVGIRRFGKVQYFDAGDKIPETVLGIVCGLSLGLEEVDPFRPLLAFSRSEGGFLKVSARISRLMSFKCIDLARPMSEAARAVGGEGGGHKIACGAYIPEEKMEDFLREFNSRLRGIP